MTGSQSFSRIPVMMDISSHLPKFDHVSGRISHIRSNGVGVSSRISGRSTPLRRTDFLARKFFDFDERLLLSTPSFSTEQLLETSESGDPDFLCSLSAQNPGA